MQRPLLSCWRISAPCLPEELLALESKPAFSLPGVAELLDFADLLGEPATKGTESISSVLPSAPFSLPACLPDALCGEASLTCEIDFGALVGDHAALTFSQLLGSGSILLGDTPIASFDSASAAPDDFPLDLTDALRRGRRETISIHFDGTRPAGICGPVFLTTTQDAALSRVALIPDAAAQTITVRVRIAADASGDYLLRALPIPSRPNDQPLPAREIPLALAAGENSEASMTLSLPAAAFVPGKPYAAPVMKILLLRRRSKKSEILCDSSVLACGYPGPMPPAYLPLCKDDLLTPPEALIETLQEMHIPGVSLHMPAPESLYLHAARAGIGVIQQIQENDAQRDLLLRHPCLSFAPPAPAAQLVSPAAAAWQLCGMTGYSRAADEELSDRALLYEAAGRVLDPQDEGVRGVLAWLVAVSVRLRCEAARQGRFSGALCEAGTWQHDDVSDAIRTALAPLHLSALPLCGAWWTGTRFSASLEAFIPEGTGGGKPLSALAVLEDEEGRELARLFMPCRAKGGYVGVIDAQLPEHPCTLELRTQLMCMDEVIEESTLPVYVGERGPLEAAFI